MKDRGVDDGHIFLLGRYFINRGYYMRAHVLLKQNKRVVEKR